MAHELSKKGLLPVAGELTSYTRSSRLRRILSAPATVREQAHVENQPQRAARCHKIYTNSHAQGRLAHRPGRRRGGRKSRASPFPGARPRAAAWRQRKRRTSPVPFPARVTDHRPADKQRHTQSKIDRNLVQEAGACLEVLRRIGPCEHTEKIISAGNVAVRALARHGIGACFM
jgi:hypothetical protein